MYTNYLLNRWFLIWYLILKIPEIYFFKSKWFFNIGSTIHIYIISFRLNNLVLIFILKKFLMKYHDKIPITSFWVCSKNERFDHSSNICLVLVWVLIFCSFSCFCKFLFWWFGSYFSFGKRHHECVLQLLTFFGVVPVGPNFGQLGNWA